MDQHLDTESGTRSRRQGSSEKLIVRNADQPAFGGDAAGRCAAFTTPACVSAAAI